MSMLNQSLSTVYEMKLSIANHGSEMDSYDSQLKQLRRDLGDVTMSNTELKSSVEKLTSDVDSVKVWIFSPTQSFSSEVGVD